MNYLLFEFSNNPHNALYLGILFGAYSQIPDIANGAAKYKF